MAEHKEHACVGINLSLDYRSTKNYLVWGSWDRDVRVALDLPSRARKALGAVSDFGADSGAK